MQTQSSLPNEGTSLRGVLQRLYYAFGPLGAGIILDVLDLATFGPIGLVVGALVGGYAGWVLGEFEGFDRSARIYFAVGAAIYMTTPFTGPLPAATLLVLAGRFFKNPPTEAASIRSGEKSPRMFVTQSDSVGQNEARWSNAEVSEHSTRAGR